jgi:hypothetical protein
MNMKFWDFESWYGDNVNEFYYNINDQFLCVYFYKNSVHLNSQLPQSYMGYEYAKYLKWIYAFCKLTNEIL